MENSEVGSDYSGSDYGCSDYSGSDYSGSDYSGLDCSEPATTRVVQVLRARKPGQRKTWQPYLPPYHIARTRGQTRRIYQHKQLEH